MNTVVLQSVEFILSQSYITMIFLLLFVFGIVMKIFRRV